MHLLGIDWADQKHQVYLMTQEEQVVSQFEVTHDWKRFEALQSVVEAKVGSVEVNLGQPDGLLVDWMVSQRWPVFVTPPRVVASRPLTMGLFGSTGSILKFPSGASGA